MLFRSAVLHEVFHALHRHKVVLELMLLKPSMVLPGKAQAQARQATPAEVAAQTIRILRRTVPAAVPSINFLSGGQTPEEATANLDAINRLDPQPWPLSFSYGRALQEPALRACASAPAYPCASGLRPTRYGVRVWPPGDISPAARRVGANALVPSHRHRSCASRLAPSTRISRD